MVLCVNQPFFVNAPGILGTNVNLPIALYCDSFDGSPPYAEYEISEETGQPVISEETGGPVITDG